MELIFLGKTTEVKYCQNNSNIFPFIKQESSSDKTLIGPIKLIYCRQKLVQLYQTKQIKKKT